MKVKAYLNHGYWKVDCPKCGKLGAVLAQDAPLVSPHWTRGNEYICPNCYPGTIATYQELNGKRVLTMPDYEVRMDARAQARADGNVHKVSWPRNKSEIERITRGWVAQFINWLPGQSMESLAASPQHNSYITPITFVALQTLTAAQMNGVQANIAELGGVFSATGNIPYAASTSTLGVLAAGANWNAVVSSGLGGAPVSRSFATVLQNIAIIASQDAGDFIYAASATTLGRLAGAAYRVMRNTAAGTAMEGFRMCEATRAKRATDLSSTSISETAIALTGEDFDDGGWHDNATNNTRITPPTTGRYRVRGQMEIENASGTNIDSVVLKIKSSSGDIIGATTTIGFVNGANIFLNVTGRTESLTAGEYFTLTTERSNVTSGVTIKATNTWLEVERVR